MKQFLSTIFAFIILMASCQTQTEPQEFKDSPMGGLITATFDCVSVYCTKDSSTLFVLPSEEFLYEHWSIIGNLDNAYYYLSITIDGSKYNIQFPTSGQITLPGHIRETFYMLYVMDTQDINLVHAAIKIDSEGGPWDHIIGICSGLTP